MSTQVIPTPAFSQHVIAFSRRFFRWLTRPHVILSLIMLVLLIYVIVIPLYRMVETTFTYQEKDLITNHEAVEGEFTLFHWVRMLASPISPIVTYNSLQHSLVTSAGATLIAMVLGCLMAWFVVRTDMPGRKLINVLAIVPYMMPSWTIARW